MLWKSNLQLGNVGSEFFPTYKLTCQPAQTMGVGQHEGGSSLSALATASSSDPQTPLPLGKTQRGHFNVQSLVVQEKNLT